MKQRNNYKYKSSGNVSGALALGIIKIIAGIPLTICGITAATAGSFALRHFLGRNDVQYYHYIMEFAAIVMAFAGVMLIYSGIVTCRLTAAYRRITKWMSFKNRESLGILSNVTKRDLTHLVNDLDMMVSRRFWKNGYVDLERAEFAAQRDGAPAPLRKDGDVILTERTRIPYKTLLAFPAVMLAYSLFRPFPTWYDLAVAAAISLTAFIMAAMKSPRVRVITEEKYKAPPAQKPAPINTGNSTLDELLNAATGYIGELNALSMSIINEKMSAPIGELLNVSRQIFAFVEKHPEKIRQIRQFMNYYLPTTIKLLQSYKEFAAEPLKGDNIKSSMVKIEESMDGIVETFRRELDNLYGDKATDITVEIDVMLSMMRGRQFSDNSGEPESVSEKG